MEAPVALNIPPLNAPHRELEWKPLADKDFQIDDMEGYKPHLQAFCEIRSSHKNKTDIFGIWESNMPIYYLPSVNVFPDLIHQCCANYEPSQMAVMGPSGNVLFYITSQSINEILQFKPTQPLVPLTMKHLLDLTLKLSSKEVTRIAKTFMPSKFFSASPPYHHAWFDETSRLLIDMISYILGFRTSEIVDENVIALVSMFALGQPPAVKYDYPTYIANKIHEQFMNLERERVFKYTSYIYHSLLYYQYDSFPVFLKKLDVKGERRSVIFWTSVCHLVSLSPYTYCEFIDLFIYPATCLLSADPPPRLTTKMQRILHLSKGYSIGD